MENAMQNGIRFLDIYIRLVAWKPIHILRAKLSNQKANKEAPIKQNEKTPASDQRQSKNPCTTSANKVRTAKGKPGAAQTKRTAKDHSARKNDKQQHKEMQYPKKQTCGL
jgi:hypothetical protein